MSGELRITELDFATIKTNLQTYLQSQTEWQDYNFDGSGLSILLDVLAYNTHYNALIAHLQSNEMFIDTAIKRASVISLAKMLGYIPRSNTCAEATVKIIVTPTDLIPPATLTLDTGVSFNTFINNTAYTFNVASTMVAALIDGIYTFNNVTLLEGIRLSNAFTVGQDTISGPFEIPVNTIDTTTILVSVQNSISDTTTTVFTQVNSVVNVLPTSQVFWIEEIPDGNYQILFGDGVVGKTLSTGNIVTVAYIASSGSQPNGASAFSLNGTVSGESNVVVQSINPAAAGAERETIDQIRFNAPKFYPTRNRAVTDQDYKSLILASLPNAKSAVVWGGDENIPPIFGKVFITIDPQEGHIITDNDKNYLLNTVFAPRSVMTLQHVFVDPQYLYIGFDVVVSYDPNLTNFTATALAAMVQAQITSYFNNNLSTLDKTFFFSQFADSLTSVNQSIVGILVDMHLQQRITKLQSFNATNDLRFLAALKPGSVRSTYFVAMVGGVSYNAYIQDFADDKILSNTGMGVLSLLDSVTNNVLVTNVGTIDYGQGVLSFSSLSISAYLGNLTDVRITAIPQELSKNISSRMVTTTALQTGAILPAPSVNIILRLDDSPVLTAINLQAGVTVTAVPYIQST